MIVVNGKEFKTYDEAIAFMQGEKENTETQEARKKLSNFLDTNLRIAVIEQNGKKNIVCVFADNEKRDAYLKATIEDLYGSKYKIVNNVLVNNYIVEYHRPILGDSLGLSMKKYFMNNGVRDTRIMNSFSINNEKYYDVVVRNYTNERFKVLKNEPKKEENIQHKPTILTPEEFVQLFEEIFR